MQFSTKKLQIGVFYSVLRDSTGSFFAAILDGMLPAIKFNIILSVIKMIELPIGNIAIFFISFINFTYVTFFIIINKSSY